MIVKEGRVVIDTGEAFYNPRMEMNRDITVACLEALPDITTYIDVMSASGIRGIRVKKEVSRDIEVTSNDWDEPASSSSKERRGKRRKHRNIELRSQHPALSAPVRLRGHRPVRHARPVHQLGLLGLEAGHGHNGNGHRAALRRPPQVRHKDIRRLPAEDRVLCRNGLRVLLGKVAREEAKYDRSLKPLLCHATEHYVRLYLGVSHGRAGADAMMKDIGFIVHCFKCKSRSELPGLAVQAPETCPVCRRKINRGPVWLGATKDNAFIDRVIQALEAGQFNKKERALRMLRLVRQELDTATFYDQHAICRDLKATPTDITTLLDDLKRQGYAASRTHYLGVGFKTDAPIGAVRGTILRLSE